MKIRKGDEVEVLSGKEIGRRGTVMRVMPADNKVIVDRINVMKKHQKPTRATMQGGIIDKEMPLQASNVGIVCDKCRRPTRVGYRFDGDKKIRICRKCEGDL